MQKSIMNLVEYLSKRPRRFIVAAGLALVLLVGVPDYLFSPRISVSIFYLIPVSLAAWFAGRCAGTFISFISALTWLSADLLSGGPYNQTYLPYWNASVRLGFFLIVVMLLNAFKREKSYAREDYLTQLGNRRRFFELADSELKRSHRYGHPFTLAYIDIDDFKAVNDRFGHAAGDTLLKSVAQAIKGNIRATDIAARLGGDEFAVLLPESGSESAKKYFTKLHRRLQGVVNKNKWPVTFSIGVITFNNPPETTDDMIKGADNLMYSAKTRGKNQVQYEVRD